MTAPDAQIQAREIALAIARKGDACECSFCIDAAQEAIARALLSERTRATEAAAQVADHRVQLARTLAPKAAGAIFVALPDAIRASIRTEGTKP